MKFFIIALWAIVLSVVAGTVAIGVKSFDGVVTDHPYETGLNWDRINKDTAELGWELTIENSHLNVGRNELLLSITDTAGVQAIDDAIFGLTLSRPSTTRYDKTYEVRRFEAGSRNSSRSVSVPVEFPLYGYWDIKLDIKKFKNIQNIQTELGVQALTTRVYVEEL